MIYTDADLSQLITCPKRITKPPRKDMRTEGQMLRDEMEFESLDSQHVFRAFIRQNRQFPENFSVGLDYLPKDVPGSFCLLRCNGMHGSNKAHPHHSNCHIHLSKADDVNAGVRVGRHIELAREYAAFRDALRYFLRTVNVQAADLTQYFPSLIQGELSFEAEAQS